MAILQPYGNRDSGVKDVYICGHKNPDTDSVCSASVYAYYKNMTGGKERRYIPIRCGNINDQTRYIYQQTSLPVPELRNDILPLVKAVARTDYPSLDPSDSVYTAIRILDEHNLSVVPVVSQKNRFQGLVSTHEINRFLIQDNIEARPLYTFLTGNFPKVIPGHIEIQGNFTEFTAAIMIGAMPFEISKERVSAIPGGKPLLITGYRKDLIRYAVRHGFPALVLTGCEKVNLDRSLFDGYRGTVFISYADTAETVRRLRLSVPVEKIMNATPDLIAADTHFSEAKETLISSSYRGLPVMENGEYYGIISRRCFIETPRNELILVDHNEIEQSIPGAAEAEITEIIDHHRMGSIRTRHPIFLDIRPLGSTSSIIYDICRKANVVLPPDHALLLLSGILSDTVILRSPTTTAFDRKCAEELAQICGCDPVSWGEEIFSRSSSLRSDDYGKTVMADFKQYNDFGYAVGISQIEVLTFQELPDVEYELYSQLHKSAHEMSLDWMLLLITNITKEESILLTTENKRLEETLVYPKLKDHQYSLKGILSRKKQLLPEVLRVLEQNRRPSDKSL